MRGQGYIQGRVSHRCRLHGDNALRLYLQTCSDQQEPGVWRTITLAHGLGPQGRASLCSYTDLIVLPLRKEFVDNAHHRANWL